MDNQMTQGDNGTPIEKGGNGPTGNSKILEVMMDRAIRYPRDEYHALERATQELEKVPGLAEDAYYSIPYENSDTGKKVPVEGLTIGASLALIRFWGNVVSGGRITFEDDKGWELEGFAYDLENNILIQKPFRVSKFYKPRGGQGVVPLSHDRRVVILQAGVSKAQRNAALAIIPNWAKDAYFTKAKQLVLNPPKSHVKAEKSLQEKILDVKNAFRKNWNVTDAEMNDYIAGLGDVETDEALYVHLVGLGKGIKEGRATADQVFGRVKDQPAMPTEVGQ